MFADDTSIMFSNSDITDYATEFIATFGTINLWFTINSLSINLNKTNCVHFTGKSNTKFDIKIKNIEDIQFNNICNIKFLGSTTDNMEEINQTTSL